MRDYELMVVLTPELDDEGVTTTTERVTSLVTARGGEVVEVQPWGRRRLAYPIRNLRDGFYAVAKLKLSPDAAEPLDRSLKLTDPVIRHLLVRLDES
jgi:small subunit ribosomal protein S6